MPLTNSRAFSRLESAGLSWPLPEGIGDAELEAALYANRRRKRGHRRHAEPDWPAVHRELKGKHVPDWIDAHVRALEAIGGVPQLLVPDNTKTAVIKACLYDPQVNRTYAEMAAHYGAAILPTRPPDQLRGPEHSLALCDELAKWQYAEDTWDMLQFGMQVGCPRQIVTTTPKPIPVVRRLLGARPPS